MQNSKTLAFEFKWLPALVLILFVTAPVHAAAANQELITDRPDQTESPNVVPRGYAQLEVGFTKTREEDAGVRVDSVAGPGSLLRIGLTDRIELRLDWVGLVDEEVRGASFSADEDGVGDGGIGAKFALRTGEPDGPEIALLATASLPTGDDTFSSDRVDPAMRLCVAHSLGDRVSLGYNIGAEWATEAGNDLELDTLSSGIYTVALGIGLNDKVATFVELFGSVPASAGGSPAHSLDGGITYLLRDNLQLDVAGGIGLSDAADDWFAGIGVSWRFPD